MPGSRLLNQTGIDGVPLQAPPEHGRDSRFDLRVGMAADNTTDLAAPAHEHLRLHHPGPVALKIRHQIRHDNALRNRNSVLAEKSFAVRLDQQHVRTFPGP